MPPDGGRPARPEIAALVKFLEAEFARADATMKPDPGRVTARRLNRAEYTNTIRDLLAIEFRADRNFPTDDSGDGFDNIARCPDRLSGPDGKVHVGGRAHRRADDGRRPAAEADRGGVQPPVQESPPDRSEQRRGDAPLRFRCRLRAQDRPARAAREGRRAGHARPLGGREAGAHDADRDQALRARLLQPVSRKSGFACRCRKAITRFASGSSTTRSSRRSPRKTSTRTRSTSGSAR